MSREYYKRIQVYVDFLFDKKYPNWSRKSKEMGAFIYKEVKAGEYCGLSKEICHD